MLPSDLIVCSRQSVFVDFFGGLVEYCQIQKSKACNLDFGNRTNIKQFIMYKKIFTSLCVICLIATNCDFEMPDNPFNEEIGSGEGSITGKGKTDISIPDISLSDTYTDGTEIIPEDDEDYVENSEFTTSVAIQFDGGSVSTTGIADGVTVTATGADVVINSSIKKVEYVLSGTTTNGSVKIYSTNKFKLTLNGVNITSTTGAAINNQSGKRTFVVVTDGTTNTLTDASKYTALTDGEDMKGALFSEGQLIFSGKGALTVKGNYKHAICSDDYIRIRKNTNISISGAPSDGIHTNDSFVQEGGTLKIVCVGDGIDVENEKIDINGGQLSIETSGAASKGLKTDGNVNITGGTIIIKTTGNAEYDTDDQDISSCAAIKCDSNFVFSNATASLTSTGSAGKGINVDGTITIDSGTIVVKTSGKQYVYQNLDSSSKGMKSKGNLTINGGRVIAICSGGEGSEGIESKAILTINDGVVEAECYDDCINAAQSIAVTGGQIYCYSSNNDGMDSNGTLSISGGVIVCSGTTVPEEGFDCDQNNFAITGGIIIGVGGATSTPTSNSCRQCSLIYNTTGTLGKLITIVNPDSKSIMTFDVPRNYSQQMTMLYSASDLTANKTFTIYTGGTITGGTTFHGLTYGHTFSNGTKATSFTTNNTITTVGSSSGGQFRPF